MSTPPDRGHVATEQANPGSMLLDELSIRECIDLFIEDSRVVPDSVAAASTSLEHLVEAVVQQYRDGGRLLYVGAGTSGRLGVLDASECPPTFCSDPDSIIGIIAGGDSALRRSSEGREDDRHGAVQELDDLEISGRDVLIGIAAGGTTPYVLGAIEHAASRGTTTGLITCSPGTSAPGCDHLIVLDTGAELLTGSTRLKAASATKLALNIITTVLFVRLGKVHGNLMVDLAATNDKLIDRAIRILRTMFPELDRSGAMAVLVDSGYMLKPAIVMHACGCDLEQAMRLLECHQGRIRKVLDGKDA